MGKQFPKESKQENENVRISCWETRFKEERKTRKDIKTKDSCIGNQTENSFFKSINCNFPVPLSLLIISLKFVDSLFILQGQFSFNEQGWKPLKLYITLFRLFYAAPNLENYTLKDWKFLVYCLLSHLQFTCHKH